MTVPRPIGQVAPSGNSGDRTEFTEKKDLDSVPLTITGARLIPKSKNGPFWIIEAARVDTGEAVVFTGSTVIDQQVAACKEQNAFPVAAMLSKIQPEDPAANWYWQLVDPPGTSSAPAPSTNGGAKSRIQEVQELVATYGLTTQDVTEECAELGGAGAKVNGLSDGDYEKLLARLMARSQGPVEEDSPF